MKLTLLHKLSQNPVLLVYMLIWTLLYQHNMDEVQDFLLVYKINEKRKLYSSKLFKFLVGRPKIFPDTARARKIAVVVLDIKKQTLTEIPLLFVTKLSYVSKIDTTNRKLILFSE